MPELKFFPALLAVAEAAREWMSLCSVEDASDKTPVGSRLIALDAALSALERAEKPTALSVAKRTITWQHLNDLQRSQAVISAGWYLSILGLEERGDV